MFLIDVFECITVAVFFIFSFIGFIAYCSEFIEKKMKTVMKFLKGYTIMLFALTFLLMFSGYSFWPILLTIVTNGLWFYLQMSNFPFINFERPDFYVAMGLSLLCQFFWTIDFVRSTSNAFIIVSFFLFFIWTVPLISISALLALAEEDIQRLSQKSEDSKPREQRNIGAFISRYIQNMSSLPGSKSNNY